MPVTAVTASTVLALNIVDANDHLRGQYDDDDTHLVRLIEAATSWIETRYGQALLNATITETFTGWVGSAFLRLARAPVSSITSITYYDADSAQQTWAASNYILTAPTNLPGELEVAPDISLPSTDARTYPWEVIYVAGYGAAETDLPDNIQHALRLLVEDFDRHRGNLIEGRASVEAAVGIRRLLSVSEMGRV